MYYILLPYHPLLLGLKKSPTFAAENIRLKMAIFQYIYKFKSKAHRKSNLADILTSSLTKKATATTKSLEKILVVKMMTYGLSQKENEEDVYRIVNHNVAINILPEKVIEEE